MTQATTENSSSTAERRPGWDALLLIVLVFALLQIVSFAEATLPFRLQDVLRHPILGNLLPDIGEAAMGTVGPRPGEPIGLLLIALTIGALIGYTLVDLSSFGRWRNRLKWLFLTTILITALFLPTGKLILLRQGSGPASYTHDGGVIQTEAAINFALLGKSPYIEDYDKTPMAEWGFSEYRTAIYHYPYLPWTFLSAIPAYLVGQMVGFYDQRLIYLLLMAVALFFAPRLATDQRSKFALVATLGLNPIMGLDIIFGQNDSFVLCWILFSLVSWHQWQSSRQRGEESHRALLFSAIFFGLACASKPTAWFFAPFYGLLLMQDRVDLARQGWAGLIKAIPTILARAWPALLTFAILVAPYLLWDPFSVYDDVWRWSNGQGETGYQIWGWGASNFVLALGLVTDRFGLWPFWVLEMLIALPILLWFLHRQQRANTLSNACWHYGIFLLAFFYTSRFLNENYLGYILAFLAIGIFAIPKSSSTHPVQTILQDHRSSPHPQYPVE